MERGGGERRGTASPDDPGTVLSVAAVLMIASFVELALPAIRCICVDPPEALKSE